MLLCHMYELDACCQLAHLSKRDEYTMCYYDFIYTYLLHNKGNNIY